MASDPKRFRELTRPTPKAQGLSRVLRSAETPPEGKLWARLRRKQLDELRFRRQHALGPFVADFYCHEARLVVEVDGLAHDRVRDAKRDAWMTSRGLCVVRVRAVDVERDIVAVLSHVRRAACARLEASPSADFVGTSPAGAGEGIARPTLILDQTQETEPP